jgi:hypothetical protein
VMREATDEYPEAISRLTTDAGLYVKWSRPAPRNG